MAELYPVDNSYPDPFKIPAANRIDHPGSLTLYHAATGFEKALADTDAERLMDLYAEAIIDQWNPWQIANEHLPFLAWAQGVNLWESWWDETMRRSWTARQWYLKSIRGKRAGLDEFVTAVGGHVKRCVVPPATAYGTAAMTDAERAAYVARFPQLRIYPYVAREQLPWLCYCGLHYDGIGLHRVWNKNGSFMGPRRPVYPTVQDAGGKYTRTAMLYEPRTGIETKLTIRQIVKIDMGPGAGWGFTPGVSQYDESVILPLAHRPAYFCGEPRKYLGVNIYLGAALPLRTISIGRSGPMELMQAKAQYQTIFPQEQLLQVLPEMVAIQHPRRKTELYAARGEYLIKAKSIVTHAVASNFEIEPPVFGRALFASALYNMQANTLSAGHPTFGAPVLTRVAGANPLSAGHPTFGAPVLTVVVDVDVAAWIAAVGVGNVSGARQNFVNNLVAGLKADGVWFKLDRLWLFAGENTQSALVDLKVRTTVTAVGSPVFTASRGYAGNGVNAYIDTGIANNSGGNYAQNSACLFGWSNTAGLDGGALVGTGQTQRVSIIIPAYTDGNLYAEVNFNSGGWEFTFANAGATGLYVVNRTAVVSATIDINGSQAGIDTSNSSLPLTADHFTALVGSGGTGWSNRQCSCMGFGGGLTPSDRTALYNRLRTFMTAIGVP